MGVEELHGQVVGLDTAPLIFYIEDRTPHADTLESFFQALHASRIRVITSIITVTEVLVHPLKRRDEKLASEYLDILLSHPYVATIPVTSAIA